jgi:abortive infection bacteriophage resistance protein
MRYTKIALTFADQVRLLESRNLIVADRAAAEEALSHISYYRLSAYFRPFRIKNSEEFDGASFADVMALYRFDKELRSLIDDALETIEIHFRTRLTYHLALAGGAFAHTNPAFFMPMFDHTGCLAKIQELEGPASDKFVSHFRTKYHEEQHLPVWMATELMSFGTISHVYGALTLNLKNAIVDGFDIHYSILTNWMHTLSYIRNICAHHGRLWNRELAIRPLGYHLKTGHTLSVQNRPTGLA